ncbi:MAG: hypothetical protein CL608_08245 [Anaerolineaceae bacterium]|nr:hypothetical protein [Anaerolineaceae bacterium]
MDDICTYRIEVEGRMNENGRTGGSPLEMVVVRTNDAATLFTICTDQSGAIGLIRYLHGRGYVLLSVVRESQI